MNTQGMDMAVREYEDRLQCLRAELEKVSDERDKLQKFKNYVHARLDAAGVPVDPESSHKAEGCRIGGRLDIVLADRKADDAEPVNLERLIEVGFCDVGMGWRSPYDPNEKPGWALLYQPVLETWREGLGRWELGFPGYIQALGYDLPTMGDVRRLCKVLKIPLHDHLHNEQEVKTNGT